MWLFHNRFTTFPDCDPQHGMLLSYNFSFKRSKSWLDLENLIEKQFSREYRLQMHIDTYIHIFFKVLFFLLKDPFYRSYKYIVEFRASML